jgi:succinate dehydrogenase/fumarate reductase-like Fe-S protein
MKHTLDVRAFFFNAKTDYLPYYKNFSISLAEDATAIEILANIKAQNEDFAYPTEKLIFKLNDLVVDGTETIGNIVEKLGTSLQVDPVLSYRSNHCLIINDEDFMKSYALLSPYTTQEDKAYYASLYATHYASETFKFSHDYIGDAILLLAHRMIENGSENKKAILAAISDPYDGLAACEYENNLFHTQDHSTVIETLNSMVTHPNTSSFLDKVAATLSAKALYTFEKTSLEGVQIACYASHGEKYNEVHTKIIEKGAKHIHFPRETKLCGRTLIGKQDNLAYLKAATTLLEALDSGAELLVVTNHDDLAMFKTHFASIQKRIGREIPLPLVSYEAFLALCEKKTEVEEA